MLHNDVDHKPYSFCMFVKCWYASNWILLIAADHDSYVTILHGIMCVEYTDNDYVGN